MRIEAVILVWLCAVLEGCAAHRGNFFEDVVEKREQEVLRDYPDLASRTGRHLEIKLQSGETKRFENSISCETYEECIIYGLYDYDADNHAFIVWKQYYEGRGASIVNQDSGVSIDLVDQI